MIIETKNLNQAAMLMALGGELVKLYDTSPSCGFVIAVKPWQLWYEKHISVISYKHFCKQRVSLKAQAYARSGRTSDFAGRKDGFLFSDVVRVTTLKEKLQ